MKVSIDRIVAIISCLYGQNAELVINQSEQRCYLFFDGIPQDLQVFYEEVDCLIDSSIIEFDSGCDEPGYETKVYRLTSLAQDKIREIIRNRKALLLRD